MFNRIAVTSICAALAGFVSADARKLTVELETGPVWIERNDVALPGDTGTRFAFSQLTGKGAFPNVRLTLVYEGESGPGWRLLAAPLRVNRTGTLLQETLFEGATFAAGSASGTYRFNSYRLTYRNRWKNRGGWDLRVGFTGKIRDAEISLEQGQTQRSKTDVGFVPLLHLYASRDLGNGYGLSIDFDGAAAPQGRAIDLSVRLERAISSRVIGFIGLRILDGGADNPEVYNFAQLQYITLGLRTRL